eukprot:4890239-Pyramimonas_sp.AAC.1
MKGASEWTEVLRGARQRRGRQQQQPTLEVDVEVTEIASWRTRPEQQERVHRVLRELRWHRVETGATTLRPDDDILAVDTAEA